MSSLLPCARFEQVGTTLSFRIGMVMLVGFILMQLLLLLVWQTPGLGGADANYGLPSPATLARMVEARRGAASVGRVDVVERRRQPVEVVGFLLVDVLFSIGVDAFTSPHTSTTTSRLARRRAPRKNPTRRT